MISAERLSILPIALNDGNRRRVAVCIKGLKRHLVIGISLIKDN